MSDAEKNNRVEYATFAAGCFWGVQQILDEIDGVLETNVGWTGGTTENPDYNDVRTGKTGHAEAVFIKSNPEIISYEDLLDYFWRLHDPTQLNRQGPDVGTQYRSVIFYHSEEQRIIAEKSKESCDAMNIFKRRIQTQILPATKFFKADDFHQKYFAKNGGMGCHFLRPKR